MTCDAKTSPAINNTDITILTTYFTQMDTPNYTPVCDCVCTGYVDYCILFIYLQTELNLNFLRKTKDLLSHHRGEQSPPTLLQVMYLTHAYYDYILAINYVARQYLSGRSYSACTGSSLLSRVWGDVSLRECFTLPKYGYYP